MIDTWEEIDSRFDAIKDHTRKEAKESGEANELYEILLSAYALNPEKASDMWQYLVDRNVMGEVKAVNVKFYIYDIFKRLEGDLTPEDTSIFVSMEPERVRLMLLYGYKGAPLYNCLAELIWGFVKLEDFDNAVACFEIFSERYGGLDINATEIKRGLSRAFFRFRWFVEIDEDEEEKDDIICFFEALEQLGFDWVTLYAKTVKVLIDGVDGLNPDEFCLLLGNCAAGSFKDEFVELVYKTRGFVGENDIITYWEELGDNLKGKEMPDMPYHWIDKDNDSEATGWFAGMMLQSEKLLNYYFNSSFICNFSRKILEIWAEKGDQDSFATYLSKIIWETKKIDSIWDSLIYGTTWRHTVDEGNRLEFFDALARVSAMTLGAEAHDQFHTKLKQLLEKELHSVDILNKYGFTEAVDNRTDTEKLFDYIADCEDGNISFNAKEFQQIYYNAHSNSGIRLQEFEDLKLTYEMVSHEGFSEKIFKTTQDLECIKSYMIFSCILRSDNDRAVELLEMEIEMKNHLELYGYKKNDPWATYHWEEELKSILMNLARSAQSRMAYGKGEQIQRSPDCINDSHGIIESVALLFHSARPYISRGRAIEIGAMILRLVENSRDRTRFIEAFLADIRNDCFSGGEINEVMRTLSLWQDNDIISETLRIFFEASASREPEYLSSRMREIFCSVSTESAVYLYRENKMIFSDWLEFASIQDILTCGRKIGDSEDFKKDFDDFYSLAMEVRGQIDGLEDCYNYHKKMMERFREQEISRIKDQENSPL